MPAPRQTAPVAIRHFGIGTTTFRIMAALGRTVPGRTYRFSQVLAKHAPAVLLALAAHHDIDAPGSRPGYTAAELAPFVGLGVGTVAATLRDLNRQHWCNRYQAPGGFRYVIAPSALVPAEGEA